MDIPIKSYFTQPTLRPYTDQFTKQYRVICNYNFLTHHNIKKLPILHEDFYPY